MAGNAPLDATLELTLDWSELVCVCCHCQRQRTPAGRWRAYTPAAGEYVSHGICPDCMRQLYPEYADLVEAV